jgi:hypothetical protein
MPLKDWERDVINRQRNIVFPDTNLNEGRFYRNIASGKAVFSWGQKVALLVITLYVTIIRLGVWRKPLLQCCLTATFKAK